MAEHAGSVRRREDPRLITGAGEFVDDLRVPGCLHAAMLRSPHAHARIVSIDASAARRAPGVVGVFVAADLGAVGGPIPIYAPHPALPVPCRISVLARERVRFVGEAVAVVVADDPYRAHDALDLIRVEYEALPAVVDVEGAIAAGATVVHDEVGSNVVAEWRQQVGDAAAALAGAAVVVKTRVRLSRGGAHPLEPRGLVARWDGDSLTVWGAVQMVHRHRGVIAGQLGVPEERVRVIAPPDVGGGFGTKGMYYPEYVAVAELARQLDRPVKWIETRREHTLVACVERDQVHDVEIGATRDGRLLALRDDFLHDMGAYTISGLNLPQNAMIHSVGPYVIPSLDLRFRAVITTTTPVGAYRGAGRPYGTGVIERAMDALARRLGVDPVEIRRRNLVPADRHPYATGLTTAGRGPVEYDTGDYPRCMDLALETLDLSAARREQARLRAEGRYLGIGVVNYVEATATVPLESAVVRVGPDGGVTVVSGAAPQGQGHVTMFSRLVGRVLGCRAGRDRGADRRYRARGAGRRHLWQPHGGDRRQRGAARLARRVRQGAADRRALAGGGGRRRRPRRGPVLRARAAEPGRRLGRGGGRRARGAGAGRRRRTWRTRTSSRCRNRASPTAPTRWSSRSIPRPAPWRSSATSWPTTAAMCSSPASSTGRFTAAWCRAFPTRSTCSSPTTTMASASPRP